MIWRNKGVKMPEDDQGRWLTVEQVAALFQITPETVRRWIRAGEVPVLDIGGPKAGYRIKQGDLDAFIAGRYGPLGKDAA